MSATIICSSKGVAPLGTSVTLPWSDIQRHCFQSLQMEGGDDGAPSDSVFVLVQPLVLLAVRRLRWAASGGGALPSSAECAVTATETSLVRFQGPPDAAPSSTASLLATTRRQGYPLQVWLAQPAHWFLLVPLLEAPTIHRSNSRQQAAPASPLSRLSAGASVGACTGMRLAATAVGQSSARRLSSKVVETTDDNNAATTTPTRLCFDTEGGGGEKAISFGAALLASPGVMAEPPPPVPQHLLVSKLELDMVNDGILRKIIPLPQALDLMRCQTCRHLPWRPVQVACCGSGHCTACAAATSRCAVCTEEASEAGATVENPDLELLVSRLVRELLVMYRADLISIGNSARGVLPVAPSLLSIPK